MRFVRNTRKIRAAIETVEPRRLLAAVSWDGGGDGTNWTNPANWSGDALPTSADDVTISVAAAPNIVIASGTQTINSLVCDEALRINAGTLAVATTADINATLTIGGGTLSGGAYDVTGGSLIASTSGGVLSNVAVTGDILLNVTSANVRLAGTTTFTAARLTGNSVGLHMAPGYTLANTVIAEGATTGTRNLILAVGGSGTVTFAPTAVVRVAAGSGAGLDIQNSSSATLVNNGLITAEATGQTLRIINTALTNNGTLAVSAGTLNVSPNNWNNPGTINGSGGTVQLNGNLNTAAGIGTLNTGGATLDVNGTITNTGNTITLNATTGPFRMLAGTIEGGAINLTAGTRINTTTSGGVLSNVAITGELQLNSTSAIVRLAGSTTFTAARLSANNATLQMSPGYTLSSTVIVEGAATGTRNINLATGGAGTVTFAPGAIVRLAAGAGAGLDIQNSSAATLINNGLISAEATGQTLRLINTALTNNGTLAVSTGTLNVSADNWTNPGTISSTGGNVTLSGTLDATAGVGTFNTAAAIVSVAGTITNTANTITLNAATGSWRMLAGTINGGSLNLTAGTNLNTTTSGGTLNNLAINGDILLNTTSAVVRLAGNTTFTTARLSANNATLQMAPGFTLNSTVIAEGATTGTRNINLATGGTGTVTFGPTAIVQLAAGAGGGLDIQNSSAATLVNNGLMSAEATGQTLRIINTALTNSGTLAVSAGTLNVSPDNWTNPGAVSGTGGGVNLGGTLNTTAGVGTFNTAAAVVSVAGTITNTGNTITLNATTGSWRMFGGTINGGSLILTAGTNLNTTTSGGTLNNLAISGDILLNTTSAVVRLAGNTTFTTARLSANNATLQMAPGYTLSNTVLAEGATSGNRNITLAVGGAGTVTFAPSAVIRLASGTGAGLDIQNSSAATLINNGLMSAEATGQMLRIINSTMTSNGTLAVSAGTLNVSPGNWNNTGTVTGTGGTVRLEGTLDATAGIGTFNTAGAAVLVAATVNNAGNTITLNAATGDWQMSVGTINGGTILQSGANLAFSPNGGTLNNVTIPGDLLLNSVSETIRLAGSTTIGTARLSANSVSLAMAPGYTFSNTIIAEGAAAGIRNIILAQGGTGTVTFAPSAIIRLAPGSGGGLDIQNSSAATLINEGLISAEAAGQSLRIINSVFTNLATGTLRADNSTLNLSTPVGPAGTVTAPGIWELKNNGRLASNFNANVIDLNLNLTGTGNAFSGNLTGASGVNRIQNAWTFASGATFNLTPAGGTLRIAGVVDLAADARLNVTGGLTFAGTNQPLVRSEIASATSVGKIVCSGVVDLANPDGGTVRFDADLIGAYDPPTGTRFDAITGTNILNDLGAFFGDTTPGGLILLVGRDNSALYSVIGVGTPPPAPSIINTAFEFETREAVNFTFNSNVSAFVSRNDMVITNLGTGQVIPNTQGKMSYTADGLVASLLTAELPNGKFRIEIEADDIANAAGDPLTTPLTFEFFILRGDANRDRVVNFDDLLIVAQNYGQTGLTFSQGNFNYSANGVVNFDDLLIVAQAYGSSVPAVMETLTSKRERRAMASEVIA